MHPYVIPNSISSFFLSFKPIDWPLVDRISQPEGGADGKKRLVKKVAFNLPAEPQVAALLADPFVTGLIFKKLLNANLKEFYSFEVLL